LDCIFVNLTIPWMPYALKLKLHKYIALIVMVEKFKILYANASVQASGFFTIIRLQVPSNEGHHISLCYVLFNGKQ